MNKYLFFTTLSCLAFFSVNAQEITEKDRLADKNFWESLKGDQIKDVIREDSAVAIVDFYRKKRWNKKRKFPLIGKRFDSKAIWFDLEKLKVFYEVVEKYNDTHDKKIDGYRLYYGVYPKGYSDHPKQLTVLIVPTILVKNGDKYIHQDVQVEDPRTKEKRTLAVLVENKGQLCPLPPCQGALLMRE